MVKGFAIVAVPPSGQVTQIGTDHARGVWVEGVSWEHAIAEHGALRAQFTLRRDSATEWPDLQPFTPITIYKGGSVVWQGRVQETPTTRGLESQITVVCEGWPAHLKDDAIEKWFVHNDMAAWHDARDFDATSLAVYTTGYTTETGGTPTIRAANGVTVPSGSIGGITLDAGPYNTIKRFVVTWIGGGHANFNLKYLAGDSPGSADETAAMDNAPILTTSFTQGFTLTTARRYVTLYIDATANTNVAADTAWVRFTDIICVTDTAYESGGLSILKASQVIDGVLPYAPKVSQSTTDITVPTFSIPHFAGPVTSPIDYMEAANDYHRYQLFLRDDAAGGPPRIVFRPIPTAALLVANVGQGIVFDDASRNDGGDIYNRCIVEYTDPAGNTSRADRTTAGLSTAFADPDIAFDTISATQPTNGGFETAGGPPPTGWSLVDGALTRDTGVFDAGAASGRFTSDGFGKVWSNNAVTDLVPGRRYLCQYRVRKNAAWLAGTVTASAQSVTAVYKGLVNSSIDAFTTAIGAAFTTRSFLFTAPPDGQVQLDWADSGGVTATADIFYLDTVQILEAHPTIVDRQGFVRTRVLTTGSRLVAAAAEQLGDVLLQAHRFTPLRGTLTIQGASLRTLLGDAPIPAHLVGGRYLGDAVLINETDPDRSKIGRVGIIASAAYDEPSDTVKCAIDTTKDFISAIVARLGIFA